jgi:hypothetical protein
MISAPRLREEIAKIGYSAIEDDYVFSDVFAPSGASRKASLAAFTHTPPSYRNAALAVVYADHRESRDVVSDYRALGAPLLFVIEGNDVTIWQVRTHTGPFPLARAAQDDLSALFLKHSEAWNPRSIHLAKSLGQFDPAYQLDFVDLGLLVAIEGEIHAKLDRLLTQALSKAIDPQNDRALVNEELLFRAVFRFLAAKILNDRSHELARTWDTDRIESVLETISGYYGLSNLSIAPHGTDHAALVSVWEHLKRGINFQNISADDLAFVYENTLVTPDIRSRFGTHSTPRQVAEYVVRHLDLSNRELAELRVYEPFAGAASFLVSALRYLREGLPVEWTDSQRHDFLVQRLTGDEIDPFACEVAMLSLILADYPNRNGWQIYTTNLFENDVLSARMQEHNVILCNPPFEAFSEGDRQRYSFAQNSPSQAVAALSAALDARPLALGFVLPRAFIVERQFAEQRRRIEALYGNVEMVELPDRIFRASKTEAALLIAKDLRPDGSAVIRLRSTAVADRDRGKFLKTGETTVSRQLIRPVPDKPTGDLWIPPLHALWSYLEPNPTLGETFTVHRGIEWNYPQDAAWSDTPKPGYKRGLHSARGSQQYLIGQPVWLDCRAERLRGGALDWPWHKPKLIVNSIRLRRGAWRLAAALDESGLVCSQQFMGIWPKIPTDKARMLELAAILNGPLANAFLSVRSPQKGIRITAVRAIPLPTKPIERLPSLTMEYVHLLEATKVPDIMKDAQNESRLVELLSLIDAAVLEAYDLPPRLEHELLEHFRRSRRPVAHGWRHWYPEDFRAYIPLHRYLSDEYRVATSGWTLEVFKPLPEGEASALREYLD